jgi:hypothetical protein
MTKDLALTLLNKGNNGEEILKILESLVSDYVEESDIDSDTEV